MADRVIPSGSIEFVEIVVGASVDPTAGTVEIGFGATEPAAWVAGTWTGEERVVSDGSGYSSGWVSRFLFGTGALDLAVGDYEPWVRVVAGVESIIRKTPDVLTVI